MPGRGGLLRGAIRRPRLVLLCFLALAAIGIALAELAHRSAFGHLVVPLTHHWDLETRDVPVRDARQRQYRARLTNWTLVPVAIERLQGARFLFWWSVPPAYRHRVERKGANGRWATILSEDLGEERSTRVVEPRKIGFGSSIHTAYYTVVSRSAPDSLAGYPLLRDGDEVRFVILARLNGADDSPGQRVLVSPAVIVRDAGTPFVR